MKKDFLFLFFLVIFSNFFSQNIRIDYFVKSGDKTYRNYLITNDKESIWKFLSIDALVQDDHLEDEYLYKDFTSNALYKTDGIFNQKMFVLDSLHQMKWELIDETKFILKKECKSAKTKFRGRNYFVWYAPSIHSANGPWKLGGLPGLILEAETEDHLFKYYAYELNENSKENVEIPDIKSEHFIQWGEFKDKFKLTIENYMKSARAKGLIDDDAEVNINILAPEIIYPKVQNEQGGNY